jgi:fido (protein-threonine AMPylation protein)
MDFDNRPYDVEKEPTYKKKIDAWEIGFGLQAADNLKPSDYLVSLADENISGNKSYDEIIGDLKDYYSEHQSINRTMEADFASVRIAEILASDSFTLSPATLINYHRRLFEGIDEFRYPVGEIRKVNISKDESVLGGKTVLYSDYRDIEATLSWDFSQQKNKDYEGMTNDAIVADVTNFISGVWQIHPFREGNTRTTAVFTIKYLPTLGYDVDNEPFKKHARYFRDSLVFDNAPTAYGSKKFLKQFMENVLLSGNNQLSRKEMFLTQIKKQLSPGREKSSSFLEEYSIDKLEDMLRRQQKSREKLQNTPD